VVALAQRTVLGAGALRAAWDAARPGCLRVCDLNVRPPFAAPAVIDAAVAHADVVKLNEAEAALVAREAGVTDAVDWMLGRGVRLVALTRGARGCALVTAAARVEHPGFPVAAGVGDPVGAGDAFVAVLAVELGARARSRTSLRRSPRAPTGSRPTSRPVRGRCLRSRRGSPRADPRRGRRAPPR